MNTPARPPRGLTPAVNRARELTGLRELGGKRPSAVRRRERFLWLVRNATDAGLKEIAQACGLRSHSAVLMATVRLQVRMDDDPALRAEMEGLLERMWT